MSENIWKTISKEHILGYAIISNLKQQEGAELIGKLFDAYIEKTGKRIDQLETAARKSDIKTFGSLAHTLKGSSGNIGANRLFVPAPYCNDCAGRSQWPEKTAWTAITKKTVAKTTEKTRPLQTTIQ